MDGGCKALIKLSLILTQAAVMPSAEAAEAQRALCWALARGLRARIAISVQ
jgi:hypothetical protein